MTAAYPLPRETRETTILSGDGVSATYGPFLFKIFDIEDVEVFTRADGDAAFAETSVTVAKTTADDFAFFTVSFPAALPATTDFYVRASRLHERSTDVTLAGTLQPDQLEKELSKQGSVLDEVRRDVDRALAPDFDVPALKRLPAPVFGEVLAGNAAGDGYVNQQVNPTETLLSAAFGRALLATADADAAIALMTYAPVHAPAVRRDLAEKLSRTPDLYDFHTSADGAAADWGTDQADCTAAVQDALTWAGEQYGSGQTARSLLIPDGVFRITDTCTFEGSAKHRALDLYGTGKNAAMFVIDGEIDGLQFILPASVWWFYKESAGSDDNFGALSFRDFSVRLANSNSGNLKTPFFVSGGQLEGRPRVPTLFHNMIMGGYQEAGQYALRWLDILDAGGTEFDHIAIEMGAPASVIGTGIALRSTDNTTDPTAFTFASVRVDYGEKGIVAGDYIEGLHMVNCALVAQNTGIEWKPTAGGEPQLSLSNSHVISREYCMDLQNIISCQIVGDNLYALDDAMTVLRAVGMERSTIVGNSFKGISGAGTCNAIDLDAHVSGNGRTLIANNTFELFDTAILLGSTSARVDVGRNSFEDVTTEVSNLGAANVVPGYSVHVTKNGDLSIATGTPTQLATWMTVRNDGGDWVASTGGFVVPAGVKRVSVSAGVEWGVGAGAGTSSLWIRRTRAGPTTTSFARQSAVISTTDSVFITAHDEFDVLPGDIIDAYVNQASGGAVNAIGSGYTFLRVAAVL